MQTLNKTQSESEPNKEKKEEMKHLCPVCHEIAEYKIIGVYITTLKNGQTVGRKKTKCKCLKCKKISYVVLKEDR